MGKTSKRVPQFLPGPLTHSTPATAMHRGMLVSLFPSTISLLGPSLVPGPLDLSGSFWDENEG